MPQALMWLLTLIWLTGACLRLRHQARYYQIEEYMSRRYLRWILADRARALPIRPVAAGLAGLALAAALDGALAGIGAAIAALIAVFPQTEGEVKKPLVITARVKRILLAAGMLAAIPLLALAAQTEVAVLAAAGFAIWLLTPLWLVAGNGLLTPLDAMLRRRYLRQARRTLAQTQPKVIGITGSYGKTTTKSFLRELLSLRYQTYATPKSYNTLMGICLAINRDLADDYRTEIFISEMGAYVEGEIARICQLSAAAYRHHHRSWTAAPGALWLAGQCAQGKVRTGRQFTA